MPEQTVTAATPNLGDLRRWATEGGPIDATTLREQARHALDRAEDADRLEAGIHVRIRHAAEFGSAMEAEDLRALLDPAQPTSPTGDADEGRRG